MAAREGLKSWVEKVNKNATLPLFSVSHGSRNSLPWEELDEDEDGDPVEALRCVLRLQVRD